MADILNFYIDDSGIRYPDRKRGTKSAHGHDWFALGGILVREREEQLARNAYANFCKAWKIEEPLHSSEIRSKNENFSWLRGLPPEEQKRFYEDLYCLMRGIPVIGLACVIDRPGYNARYRELYKQEPWLLCKTAFSVAVERAAKYAQRGGMRLRVAPERCNKKEDSLLKNYYEELRSKGLPFSKSTSEKYQPLSARDFSKILYELKPKFKTSPMSQIADLYLWPICIGGYHAENRPYMRLKADGKLIECHLTDDELPTLATKYSCFDHAKEPAENTKVPAD